MEARPIREQLVSRAAALSSRGNSRDAWICNEALKRLTPALSLD